MDNTGHFPDMFVGSEAPTAAPPTHLAASRAPPSTTELHNIVQGKTMYFEAFLMQCQRNSLLIAVCSCVRHGWSEVMSGARGEACWAHTAAVRAPEPRNMLGMDSMLSALFFTAIGGHFPATGHLFFLFSRTNF